MTWAAEQSIHTIHIKLCSSVHVLFEHQLTATRLALCKGPKTRPAATDKAHELFNAAIDIKMMARIARVSCKT